MNPNTFNNKLLIRIMKSPNMFWSIERLNNTSGLTSEVKDWFSKEKKKKRVRNKQPFRAIPQSNPEGLEWLGCLMLASEFPEITTSCPCPTPITRAIRPLAEQISHLTKQWGQACRPDVVHFEVLRQHLLPDQGSTCPLPVLKVNLNKQRSKVF